MKEGETVVDVFCLQDGENAPFFSYITHDQAQEIYAVGGFNYAESVIFKETTDRPIPTTLKEGKSCITNILVMLEPNVEVCLN